MNLSKNLIVALLGLGCYARSNSINLANNTTILLIILALLAKNNSNDDNIEIANNTRTTINACPCDSGISYNTPAPVVYQQPYYCYQQYQPVVPFNYQTTCHVPAHSWNYNQYSPRCTYPCNNCLY